MLYTLYGRQVYGPIISGYQLQLTNRDPRQCLQCIAGILYRVWGLALTSHIKQTIHWWLLRLQLPGLFTFYSWCKEPRHIIFVWNLNRKFVIVTWHWQHYTLAMENTSSPSSDNVSVFKSIKNQQLSFDVDNMRGDEYIVSTRFKKNRHFMNTLYIFFQQQSIFIFHRSYQSETKNKCYQNR